MEEDKRKKGASGRRDTDMVARLLQRMDAVELWNSTHTKECAEFRKEIKLSTSVLPEIKKQLDQQDKALEVIRTGKAWFNNGRKGIVALIALAGFWTGVQDLFHTLITHWSTVPLPLH